MDALSKLAKGLGLGPNAFQIAGTKDKRGVTTQRVNAFKLHPDKLRKLMWKLPFGDSLVVGNLDFEDKPQRLGVHGGTRFTIVLRDVSCSAADLEASLRALDARGFINYFGLQRFGNNAAAGTHHLGMALLRSDFSGAVNLILSPREGEREDDREARELWASTRDAKATLAILPRRMGIERQVLEGVARHGLTNPLQAILGLPRNLRGMYLHAFQSYVFNHAASTRISKYGADRAVAGDLVWHEAGASSAGCPAGALTATVDAEAGTSAGASAGASADPSQAAPAPREMATAGGSIEGGADVAEFVAESGALSAEFVPHFVTEEEARAGKYGIDDVLLPLPGHKVSLPRNEVGEEYARLMEESGIDPASLAHKQKELALPGSYRKLMQRPLHMTWRVMYYDDPELPLAPTDLTTLRGLPEPDSIEGGRLTAARLEFTLPASTYATMCLRELTKQSTELAHQMSLNERSVSGAPQQPKPAEGLDATTNGATTGAAEE